MSKPTPKTPEQERKEIESRFAQAARELASQKTAQEAVDTLGPAFLESLKSFEASVRDLAPEKALVIAAAVHRSVERRLLNKCGTYDDAAPNAVDEAKRVSDLQNAVHDLTTLGKTLEKRMVTQGVQTSEGTIGGPVTGVGRMTLAGDKAKGSDKSKDAKPTTGSKA